MDRVAAVLERSVAPSVIARGGAVQVVSLEDGVLTLEMSGSPGAVLPLVSRIDAMIRAAVPEVTRVRVVAPGEGSPAADAREELGVQIQAALDAEINPVIAAHRGHVTLIGVEEGAVRIRLEGGCQGCSLAEVTIRQGIEPLLRARVSQIVAVFDTTDHEAGAAPFFSAEKR
ncbi:MAG: NifU family protein [Candidatus Dormibacteria bacterium]